MRELPPQGNGPRLDSPRTVHCDLGSCHLPGPHTLACVAKGDASVDEVREGAGRPPGGGVPGDSRCWSKQLCRCCGRVPGAGNSAPGPFAEPTKPPPMGQLSHQQRKQLLAWVEAERSSREQLLERTAGGAEQG